MEFNLPVGDGILCGGGKMKFAVWFASSSLGQKHYIHYICTIHRSVQKPLAKPPPSNIHMGS
jgi:hypothetical protein